MKYQEKKHNKRLQRLKTKILMIQFKFYYQFYSENNCFSYLINFLKSSSYSGLVHLENGRKRPCEKVSCTSSKKKIRKLKKEWLKEESWPWLRYDDEKGAMFCDLCIESTTKIPM